MPIWLLWTLGTGLGALAFGEGARRAGEGVDDLGDAILKAVVAGTAAAIIVPPLVKAIKK